MDTSRTFPCTVVHPRLLPAPLTDPGNPLRVPLLVEVDRKELIIRASAASAKGKIIGTEPVAKIDRIIVERLSGGAQRLEILRRSLLRLGVIGGLVLVFALFIRTYALGLGLLMALIVAVFIGALNFLLNGGFTPKHDVVRFQFTLAERHQAFYLEVPPPQESGLRQALLAVGLKPEDLTANQ
jgi:hypothetical protein